MTRRPVLHRARHGLALALALVALLVACAGGGRPKPQPLEPLTPKITPSLAWTQRIESIRFPLSVSTVGEVFTLAGDDGTVVALAAATGQEVWRMNAGAKLSAGVGSDGRFAAVVTRDNELVLIEKGQVRWRKSIGSRSVTAPLVAGERVFTLGVDRVVQAFDALDGRKLWALQRSGDPLTLAQSGVVAAFKNTLVIGQGPRLLGVDPLQGSVKWEVAVGAPRGANEIERLADMVGPVVRVGDVICARSYQAAVGCVDAERGTLVWSKNVGGTDALAGDAELLFGGDATDRLAAWKTGSGDGVWSNDKLQYRSLGPPAVFGDSVVFGDEEGTLHWFARASGEAQLRTPTDGSAIAVAPVASGTTLLVVTRKGGLYAFRR